MPNQPTLNPVEVVPVTLKSGDRLGFKIIAVIGYGNDWRAYRGLSHWSDIRVAKHGDKVDKEIACALFSAPGKAGLIYMR